MAREREGLTRISITRSVRELSYGSFHRFLLEDNTALDETVPDRYRVKLF